MNSIFKEDSDYDSKYTGISERHPCWDSNQFSGPLPPITSGDWDLLSSMKAQEDLRPQKLAFGTESITSQ